MELIRGIYNISPAHKGCVLTIGNFDGVHKGHAQVVARLIVQAKNYNLPAIVMTFEPQPKELFFPEAAPARLSLLRDKITSLSKLGVERLLCVNFNMKFSQLSATDFIEQLLVKKLGVKYLVVGDDFRFGQKRQGDFALLQQAGEQYGFKVVSTQSVLQDQTRISSTMIREQLMQGNLTRAAQLLGRPFTLSGRVAHGQKLGRTIGFPTANIALKRQVSPVHGVFAVIIHLENGESYQGVANVGVRPTVQGKVCQLEVHIFKFNGDLYGHHVIVEFVAKIRNEQSFASIEALKKQITDDAEKAKALFKDHA